MKSHILLCGYTVNKPLLLFLLIIIIITIIIISPPMTCLQFRLSIASHFPMLPRYHGLWMRSWIPFYALLSVTSWHTSLRLPPCLCHGRGRWGRIPKWREEIIGRIRHRHLTALLLSSCSKLVLWSLPLVLAWTNCKGRDYLNGCRSTAVQVNQYHLPQGQFFSLRQIIRLF